MGSYFSVYIPTISKDNQFKDELIEISVKPLTQKSIDFSKKLLEIGSGFDLDPRMASFYQPNLTDEAQHAKEMVEALGINLPLALELNCDSIIGNSGGVSMQLGIATGFLQMAGYTSPNVIFASGCLVKDKPDKGVNIAAVCGLPQKMALVLKEKKERKWLGEAIFFVPTHYKLENGKDRNGRIRFKTLPTSKLQKQIEQLKVEGIEVITVESLTEVIEKLTSPNSTALPNKTEKTLLVVLLSLVILVAGWGLMPVLNTNQKPSLNESSENSPATLLQKFKTLEAEVKNAKKELEDSFLKQHNKSNRSALMLKADTITDPIVLKQIAFMYYKGLGVPRNIPKTIQLLTKASQLSSRTAAYYLATIYFTGDDGVAKNHTEAAYWLEQSAQNGYKRAMFFLGCMYYDGIGVKADKAKAIDYLKEAGNGGGLAEARHKLEAIQNNKTDFPKTFWERFKG